MAVLRSENRSQRGRGCLGSSRFKHTAPEHERRSKISQRIERPRESQPKVRLFGYTECGSQRIDGDLQYGDATGDHEEPQQNQLIMLDVRSNRNDQTAQKSIASSEQITARS